MPLFIFVVFFIIINPVYSQEVHFFGSMNFAKTTTDDDLYYNGIENEYRSATLGTAGINVSTKIDENSTALVQVIQSPVANKLVIDLVQYQISLPSDFTIRLGNQRLPAYLKSEVIQVQALYPWIGAPLEVYGLTPMKSFSGISIEKNLGNFNLQVYGGEVRDLIYQRTVDAEIRAREMLGARLNFRKDNLEAYISAIKSRDVDITFTSPTVISGISYNAQFGVEIDHFEFYSAGFSWDNHQFLIMSEAVNIVGNHEMFKSAQAAYTSLGYYLNEKYLLVGTYSSEFERKTTFSPSKTSTYELTLNYAINLNTTLKFGVSHIDFRRKEVASASSPTGRADAGGATVGSFDDDFDIYSIQLAFVY